MNYILHPHTKFVCVLLLTIRIIQTMDNLRFTRLLDNSISSKVSRSHLGAYTLAICLFWGQLHGLE